MPTEDLFSRKAWPFAGVGAISYHPGMEVSKADKIIDILERHEGAAGVLLSFDLPCHECVVSTEETLEEGARLTGKDPDAIIEKLRALPDKGGGDANEAAES